MHVCHPEASLFSDDSRVDVSMRPFPIIGRYSIPMKVGGVFMSTPITGIGFMDVGMRSIKIL